MVELVYHAIILACVTAIAAGQVLFKYAAISLGTAGTPWHASVLAPLALALGTYGVASLAWVWVLQYVPLSRAYPFMALGFALVPAAGWLLFGERLDARYLVGVLCIAVGVVLTSR